MSPEKSNMFSYKKSESYSPHELHNGNTVKNKNIRIEHFPNLFLCRFVAALDLFRLLVMHNEGGLYADIDRMVNVPLDTLLGPETRMVLPTRRDHAWFSQDLIYVHSNSKLERSFSFNF